DRLECLVAGALPGCRINGRRDQRLPGVTSITFPGVPADAVLAAMPDVAASEGSACASGAPTPSHVLLAMGLSRADADSTIRFSLGYATTDAEIEYAAQAVKRAVTRVRAALAEADGARRPLPRLSTSLEQSHWTQRGPGCQTAGLGKPPFIPTRDTKRSRPASAGCTRRTCRSN